jgi:hypothetical protein
MTLAEQSIDEHNKAIEARELEQWQDQPDSWNVYIVKRDDGYWAETWLSTKLSTSPVKHSTYRSNIARNMSSVRFRATNGAEYYGRYGSDWAQFCRVRKAKTP